MVVVYIFNNLIYNEGVGFIPFAISIFILGLVFSHLMKITIKGFGILQKRFTSQIFSLAGMVILFSFVGTFVWMIIMVKAGYWKIEGNNDSELRTDFFHEFFFNLFPVLLTLSGWMLIYFLFHYVRGVRKEEQLKIQYQLQTTELEAKALRAQMNPHFVFNCLNSIKALIQDDQKQKSVTYLTIFSKLIRTLFNNADKKEITLYDEIETCKLYLQLESIRFDPKFSYTVNVDETIDLKSLFVPALIIQPFIENAIWHGIVPKDAGGNVSLSVTRNNGKIEIMVEDNGIGREASMQSKAKSNISHQSKGVNLTQTRLELDNLMRRRNAELEIEDKIAVVGKANGTRVIIRMPQEP
jgi:sensor histidine kinase YesM